jgi:RNA polymerase sigma-70 factor (ECF subfamily)
MTRGDSHLTDDLAQETFVKAWRNITRLRGASSFSTWLFSIAHNEYQAFARRRKESELLDEDWDEELPGPGATTDPGALRLDIESALERLGAAERAAIILCCQYGLTHEEAAQALDCPVGTVKTRVLRGKEKLKHYLSVYNSNHERV